MPPQRARKRRHVGRRRLKVHVKPIDGREAERAEDFRRGGGWWGPEHVPQRGCPGGCFGRGGEAAFGVGCAAEGEEDGLSEGLAGLDVFSVGGISLITRETGVRAGSKP